MEDNNNTNYESELQKAIYDQRTYILKNIEEEYKGISPWLYNDFKHMLVHLIAKDGETYRRYRNDYTRYHVDAFNDIFNRDIKKWYQRELKTRDIRIHLDLFKDYVIILSCGCSEFAGATVIIPEDMTNEQIEELDELSEVLKRFAIILTENGKQTIKEKGEEFVYESRKQYTKTK